MIKNILKFLQRKAATAMFKAASGGDSVSFEDTLMLALDSASFTDKQMFHIVSKITSKHRCVATIYHINAVPLVHQSIKLQLQNGPVMAVTVNGLN